MARAATTMTVAEAAEQWLAAKKAKKAAETKLAPAEKVLKEHFRKTGRATYKDLVAYSKTTYTGIDLDAVRAELGKKIERFEVTRERETLSPLK